MSAPTSLSPSRLRAARVLRAHGVHGQVRVESLGGDPARFARGLRIYPEGDSRRLTVRSARGLDGGAVLLGFDEIRDTGAARALQGAYLCVDASAARPLGEDEWFIWQLVGLRAVDAAGEPLGVVEDVEAAVGNDVLVVRDGDGRRRFPMVREFVRSVDPASGTVTIVPWDEEG